VASDPITAGPTGPAGRVADLEARVAELEDFAAMLAHDLQGPARRMASFADLLAREFGPQLPEPGIEYLRYITEGAHRLRDLVAALHTWVEADSPGIETGPVDTDAVLAGVLHDLAEPLRAGNVEIDVEQLPRVIASPPVVGYVLQALVERAIVAGGDAGVRLNIRGARAEGSPSVEISVEDDSVTFAGDEGVVALRPFRTLSNMSSDPTRGLRLTSAQRLVEAVGGSLELHGREDTVGTRVVITLPAADSA
jgi:two-component system sensor histidine kinase/response regulator